MPFLDSAISAISDGGLLAVTCTDLKVLCSPTPQICQLRYGSSPLGREYCHEFAMRIVLRSISQVAATKGLIIKPIFSMSKDFYIRLFLTIQINPREA